jgi:hypothetical protein
MISTARIDPKEEGKNTIKGFYRWIGTVWIPI